MCKKVLISLCLLFALLPLGAQTVKGIRIDGGNTPILVYLDGTQMCVPAVSCFIANLHPGSYLVEVFDVRPSRPGERVRKGERLYSERVHFDGHGMKEITVGSRGNGRPERPGQFGQGGAHRPDRGPHAQVMDDRLFKTFLDKVKKTPFDDDRMALINAALAESDFTSAQCLQLTRLYTFDDDRMAIMKRMYPRIVDKDAFFTVISTLTFTSSQNEMNAFVADRRKR